MGPAVKLAKETKLISEADLSLLEKLKAERDWVAHKVQHTAGDSVLSPWGRLELIRRLDQIATESQAILAVLIDEMQRFVESTGHEIVTSPRLAAFLEADRKMRGASQETPSK